MELSPARAELLGDRLAQLAAAQPSAADSANGTHPPAIRAPGYDINMIIDGKAGTLRIAARAEEPLTGRVLEVWTTQPGFQFFTPGGPRDPNFIQRGFGSRPAFCIETEHYPDSPNHPNFPTTEITPEKPLHEVTVFRFGTDKVPMPLQVHKREGEPCPRCGTTIEAVFFSEHQMNYCPKEQTGGRVLKDRRLSKLLK